MGLYNSQGQRKVTIVDGNTYTGIYAPDGSYNGVITNGSTVGLYHPCGAYNVTPTDKYTNPLPVYAGFTSNNKLILKSQFPHHTC